MIRIAAFLLLLWAPAALAGSATFYPAGSNNMTSASATLTAHSGAGNISSARQYDAADFPPNVQTCRVFHGWLPAGYAGQNLRARTTAFSRSAETGSVGKLRAYLYCVPAGDDFGNLNIGNPVGQGDFRSPGQYDLVNVDHGDIPQKFCEGNSFAAETIAILRICRRGEISSDYHSGTISVLHSVVEW